MVLEKVTGVSCFSTIFLYVCRFNGDNVLQFLLYLPLGVLLMCIRIVLALVLWIASIIMHDKPGARHVLSTLACWTFG